MHVGCPIGSALRRLVCHEKDMRGHQGEWKNLLFIQIVTLIIGGWFGSGGCQRKGSAGGGGRQRAGAAPEKNSCYRRTPHKCGGETKVIQHLCSFYSRAMTDRSRSRSRIFRYRVDRSIPRRRAALALLPPHFASVSKILAASPLGCSPV